MTADKAARAVGWHPTTKLTDEIYYKSYLIESLSLISEYAYDGK